MAGAAGDRSAGAPLGDAEVRRAAAPVLARRPLAALLARTTTGHEGSAHAHGIAARTRSAGSHATIGDRVEASAATARRGPGARIQARHAAVLARIARYAGLVGLAGGADIETGLLIVAAADFAVAIVAAGLAGTAAGRRAGAVEAAGAGGGAVVERLTARLALAAAPAARPGRAGRISVRVVARRTARDARVDVAAGAGNAASEIAARLIRATAGPAGLVAAHDREVGLAARVRTTGLVESATRATGAEVTDLVRIRTGSARTTRLTGASARGAYPRAAHGSRVAAAAEAAGLGDRAAGRA